MDSEAINPPAIDAAPEPAQAEAAVEAVSETKIDDNENKFAENFARLARREKALREREREWKIYQQKAEQYDQLLSLKEQDPFAFLEKNGITYDALTRKLLENPKTAEQRQLETLEQKIAKWERDQEEATKQQTQREQERAYHNAISEIKKLVEVNGDKYELVAANEAFDLVLQTLGQYHEETGKWVSYDTAAEWVEEHLTAQAEKLAATKKLSAKFAPKTQESGSVTEPKLAQALSGNSAARTLSNNLAHHTAPTPTGRASTDELMQRALQAMRNQATAG